MQILSNFFIHLTFPSPFKLRATVGQRIDNASGQFLWFRDLVAINILDTITKLIIKWLFTKQLLYAFALNYF